MWKHAHKFTEKVFKSHYVFQNKNSNRARCVGPACCLSYIHCWGLGVACAGGSFVQEGSKVLEAERRYDAEEAGPLMALALIEVAPPPKLLTPREQNR